MNDTPDAAADGAASTTTPAGETTPGETSDARAPGAATRSGASPDLEAPAGDPELAALVRRAAAPDDADAATATDIPAAPEPDVPTLPAAAALALPVPPARSRRRRSLVLRFGVAFVLGLLLAVGVGAGALYAWGQQYDGRVLPGVSIGSTDLGGLNREEAAAAIESALGWLGIGQIALTDPDGRITTISYADVGRGPDTTALLDAALAAGHHAEPLADLVSAPRTALDGVTLQSAVVYDHDRLAAAVEALAVSINQVPVDATVFADEGGTFTTVPAIDGRAVDKTALLAALEPQLGNLGAPASITLDVPVVSLVPAVSTATVEAAKAAADRMVADVVVARGDDSWTIDSANLRPLISFSTNSDGSITPVLDEAGLDPMLEAIAPKVKQSVRDASLKLVSGRVVATGTSREGRTLRVPETKAAILGEIGARQAGASGQPVEAVVKIVEPKLSSADAEAFAPKMKVIGKYSVYYWVIVNNHWGGNIEAPATAIHGTVVPAGTKFDFWKVVGDVSRLPGVGPGNAIVDGKITVTGALAGGICTTSTTLFNAAFRAGMVPLAKKNHNEYITRYPPGLDATVWIVGKAKQTMSFMNDTKYPILITRSVTQDGSKRWLTFRIWSVPNGRTAKVSNLVIQHGPRAKDTVVEDPTKPVGYRYRNNDPADGAKVWVTVTIYDHGKKHFSKRYFSNYPAVDGVLIVGTKGAAAP